MITGKSLEEMDFAGQYELLIQNILSNTKTKLFCMGPFLFPHPQEYAGWLPVICRMEEIIEDLARKYALPFLPLQERLNEAADEYGYDAITADGVHLTAKGHRLLADALKEMFRTHNGYFGFIPGYAL